MLAMVATPSCSDSPCASIMRSRTSSLADWRLSEKRRPSSAPISSASPQNSKASLGKR